MGRFQLCQNWRRRWFWRFRARDGEKIAVSSRSWATRGECLRKIEELVGEITKGVVIEAAGAALSPIERRIYSRD